MKVIFAIATALLIGVCILIAYAITPIAIIWMVANQNAKELYHFLERDGFKLR